MGTYGASFFMKTAKPDVLPGMPSVLMASHFSLFSLSMVFPVSKMGSQSKNLDGLSMLIKDKKEQTSFTKETAESHLVTCSKKMAGCQCL